MADDKQQEAEILVKAEEVTPVSGGTVEVTAPSDLPEGYELQVDVNGRPKSVTVPAGGVKAGDSFHAEPVDMEDGGHYIPRGAWRDGLCDCCRFGCCHPMCCLGYWCQPILAGQVMTRMSRSWMGGPGPRPSVSKTCQTVTGIWIGTLLLNFILQMVLENESGCPGGYTEYNFDTNEQEIHCPDGSVQSPTTTYQVVDAVLGSISGVFFLYLVIALCRTRRAMRAKYHIQAGTCGESCEDCCCAWFCSCCAVQQMARHTNDYEKYDVNCCSNDCFNTRGQPDHLPEIDP